MFTQHDTDANWTRANGAKQCTLPLSSVYVTPKRFLLNLFAFINTMDLTL